VIAWSELNPVLISLIGRLADLSPGFKAEHADRPRTLMSVEHKQTLTLQVVSAVPIGDDEERVEQIADGATGADAPWAGQLRMTTVGHRRVSLRVVCDSQENTDNTWAWMTIGRIQTRLGRASTSAELNAVSASINRIGNATEANFKHAGRIFSRVLLDFVLNVRVSDAETDPTGWIEFVEVTSLAQDLDGELLPTSLRPIERQIPSS
jgi:hypothetical protein